MKTVNFVAKVRKAYGKPLTDYGQPAELSFGGSYEAFTDITEVPAEKQMSEADILDVINNKELARVRAAEQTKLFESVGIEAPVLSPEEKAFNLFVKGLTTIGWSEEDAAEMAKATLQSKK